MNNDEPKNIDQIKEDKRTYTDLSQRDKRSLLFHLLYAVDSYEYELSLVSVVNMFNRGFSYEIPLECEVTTDAQSIIDNRIELDESIQPFLQKWRLDRIGLCTKLILRIARWELEQKQTKHTIVINEAIELAKCFAEKDAYKFVNGVLDEMVKKNSEFIIDDGDESKDEPENGEKIDKV